MDSNSDSDDSDHSSSDSELECDIESDEDDIDPNEQLNPEPNAPLTDSEYPIYSDVFQQLNAKLHQNQLDQLHREIKARASIPKEPAYQKLPRTWPPRPSSVRTLPESIKDPIHYFELFWTLEV